MCSKSGLFYLKFMSSACQDSSTRGIFQKAKSNNNYEQVNEEKKKTEICKNFLFKGSCKYQENCSFAHGDNELRDRVPANENFKTKPCKNYHKFGTCSYGLRCQYLHSEIKDKIKCLKRIWFHLLFHGKSKTRHHRSKEQTF
ncbi:unnamed protein product (macronuclear) [Paramecium tetraurelia]|uniref:C3H1-type domain-containing protein n=1 Tax=Paramecium tetraurelia TaxID=5888 RepID=A0BAX1_PARTE|nr:uncharacterized protein GSPATT00000123001 [Paramecium tetraurelia]CAK55688.1 unnamed protein product [Paramecium tetraurelia]|eukprot:XP_001423086.1 hypothetical protein (macronuclear) [Paramecium tetraurelia strain d4-2]